MSTRIQDDLYMAINEDFLATAVIPEDRPTTGGFSDLDQGVEKILMKDFKEFANGEKKSDIKEIEYATELYKKVIDTEKRNSDGITPIMPLLATIKSIKTIEDLNSISTRLALGDLDLPFAMGVDNDMADATKYSFVISSSSIILPDTTYYAEDNQAGKQLLEVYKDMASKALAFTNLSDDEKKLFLDDTIAYDDLLAKEVKSQLEWADYTKNYNPMPIDEVIELVKPFDLKKLLVDIYGAKLPSEIIIYDPKAIKNFKNYFNESTFTKYVHWLYVKTLLSHSSVLSEELNEIGSIFIRTLTGVEKVPVIEKQAYQLVSKVYSEPIGVYYGRTYFGEEAKKDVVSLVKSIIETYKVRMKKNTFLEEKTKEKAILKLSTIVIKMGYPDKVDEFYSNLSVSPSESYFETMERLKTQKIKHQLEKLWKPVDREEWVMPGHMVNACYNPSLNDITFPAAILQAPFYSINQTVSQNLGGIGAVIGHEISHAFDNNGAQFDENGNLFNWWSEGDYAAFQKLTQDMIDQFDGIPFHGGKVNGELVVSENIADNGGMGVTLEIMHNTKGADFKEYFINWAKIWCRKAKEELILYLLSNDVHSPAELRANITPRNFPEWYEAFGATSEDEMYIEPAKRVTIW